MHILGADYRLADLEGPYRVVISALSIYHLENEDKRALLVRGHGLLASGCGFRFKRASDSTRCGPLGVIGDTR
ncbi:hypothetical protein DFAR_1160002 [Desulfarculales bacterium]